jgi:hypothetical protein
MHVLSGPGLQAVRPWIAQATLAVILITVAPNAGVPWVVWVLVGSAVLIASAALLAIWPGERRDGAPERPGAPPRRWRLP